MANEIEKYQYNKLMEKINTLEEETDTAVDTVQTVIGKYKKYMVAGSDTFIVPPGVTTIVVSGIGGGGGGGGGGGYAYDEDSAVTAGGGGGGGAGVAVLDQSISVTPGEYLTVTIGAPGEGGAPFGQMGNDDALNGASGLATTLTRGSNVIFTAGGGSGGSGGGSTTGTRESSYGSGGSGGSVGGGNGGSGGYDKRGGFGGGGGINSIFKNSGRGGNGGRGGNWRGKVGNPGKMGYPGGMCICWGENASYTNVPW